MTLRAGKKKPYYGVKNCYVWEKVSYLPEKNFIFSWFAIRSIIFLKIFETKNSIFCGARSFFAEIGTKVMYFEIIHEQELLSEH